MESRIVWVLLLAGIGWMVSSEERLQRFMTLQDTESVGLRFGASVNRGFADKAMEYPLGNGLAGGGTSVPYFLQDRVQSSERIENEYARILLEEGLPGLGLWIVFICWIFTRRNNSRLSPWFLARRLAWFACVACFAMAILGTGLLTSLPGTCLLLLSMGWIAVRPIQESESLVVPLAQPKPTAGIAANQQARAI